MLYRPSNVQLLTQRKSNDTTLIIKQFYCIMPSLLDHLTPRKVDITANEFWMFYEEPSDVLKQFICGLLS